MSDEIADLTGRVLGGLMAYQASMPEADAIAKAIRMARATVAALATVPITTPPPTGRTVLTPADLTYLGAAGVPLDDPNQTRFGYSTGALSGRVVDGAIHLFITGAQADTGWNDPVYELAWHGVGIRCSLVTNWGDVTQGTRVSAAGNAKPLHGLLWDDVTQQLLWTYLDQYNVEGQHDPCIGSSTLDVSGVQAAGPWRTEDHAQQVGGYLVALPASTEPVLGALRFAAGAPIGSGNYHAAWGAFLAAFALPLEDTPPDTDPAACSIPTQPLISSDFDHRQPRPPDADECGWTHYGEPDSHGDEPQWNPTQDGTGCTVNGEQCGATFGPLTHFGAMDTVSAAAWIEGPTKHGLVLIGQLARTIDAYAEEYGALGRCHVWYGPPQDYGAQKLCPHGQDDCRYGPTATGPGCTTMQSTLWIYDPADLAAVAQGDKSASVLPPSTDAADLSLVAHRGTAFPQLVAFGLCAYGGAWYEPTSQTLFVSAVHSEWQGEWRPVIHAFQVNS